jgi:hypothetical protein
MPSPSPPSVSISDVVDDLDDLLAGRDRLQHLGADGPLAHLVGEGAHDLERDVGLEQRAAHLAQRGVDVLLGQRAPAGQTREDAGEPVAQRAEHADLLASGATDRKATFGRIRCRP